MVLWYVEKGLFCGAVQIYESGKDMGVCMLGAVILDIVKLRKLLISFLTLDYLLHKGSRKGVSVSYYSGPS